MIQGIIDFFKNFGMIGMFVHSFIDAIIFPIPAFFSQVSLSVINPSSALWLATIGYIACILGTPFGYWLGKVLGDTILRKYIKKQWVDRAANLFQQNGESAILIGAFTPIPFKVFTILSGVVAFSLWKLIVYAALGRAVKFYAVGIIFYFFGRASEQFITTYLSYILLLIAIILALIVYIRKRREKKTND